MRSRWTRSMFAGLLFLAGCSGSDADLSEAVAEGDISRIQELIAGEADLSEPVVFGMTPLMRAANRREDEIVELLLGAGADVDETGTDGLSPLHVAAGADAVETGRLLLGAGADPALRSTSGFNALDEAAASGSSAFIRLLADETELALDAPSQAVTQGHGYPRDLGPTPLGLAARGGHVDALATLLELGADPNAPTASDHTPLLLAIFFDQGPEIARALIDAGADIHVSAACDLGCSVGDGEPLTARQWAEALGRTSILRILEGSGA